MQQAKKGAHLERIEALLGSRPRVELTKACPEAEVVTFEEAVDQMEATDYEATEETEAAMKRQ
jgi:hypothetical protein